MNDDNPTMDAAVAASDDCGCAPTPAERRTFWSGDLTRRNAIALGALSAVAIGAFGVGVGVNAAYAADYPSWDDVQKAKSNEAAKAAEVTRIEGLIQTLTQRAAEAEAAAKTASEEFYTAQQEYLTAAKEAEDLQAQADAQSKKADESAQEAGQVATRLYRNGGDEAALELFFSDSAADADGLLARLGTMDKLLEYNRTVYDNAVAARNAAQSLSDQAAVMRDERDRLQKIAEDKMVKAQQAADAAAAILAEKQANLSTLQAQLAALKDTTAKTVSAYQEGERIRKAEEERRRKAEEERRRKEAEEAAKNGGHGGGGGGGAPGGAPSASGWARPHDGRITSNYGRRPLQCSNGVCGSTNHLGLDFANGCGSPTYAAAAGRVVYAGWNGGYGNYVRIDHGGGIGSGYAHSSRLAVSSGQWVSPGQVIAYAGNTGQSLGCHLHFELYTPNGTTNPRTWLRNRGVNV